jgi:glucans biosynthesis protein
VPTRRHRSRKGCARLLAAAPLLLALLGPAAAAAFDFDHVTARARLLAAEPWHEPPRVPEWMRVGSLTYDQWRDIRFRPERALWRKEGLPFQAQLFHPGLFYDHPVKIHVVEGGEVRPLPFSTDDFDYGRNRFARRIPADLGHAGFRVHHPLRTPGYFDELVVFLGASYFRALGRDNVYGLSARGLAIDTVEPSGEEFPSFTEFWLEAPRPDASRMVIHALLDGPSVAGAWHFEVEPGAETRVAAQARLFPRRRIGKLGLAPLTSMFFFGENATRRFDDFRPEVHDSDGLLVHFGSGEWLWRPLDNPGRISASSLFAHGPRGFGLLQRDRDLASYQDFETRMELRPSAWVELHGDWGPGRIELIEIPSRSEFDDNVVAFWVPETPPPPGGELAFSYTVSFYSDDPARPPAGRTVATRRDGGTLPGGQRFVVDFDGERLRALPPERPPRANVSAGPGPGAARIADLHLVKHPATGGWRLTFQLERRSPGAIELRAFLSEGEDVLTETWSYALHP